MTLQSIFSTPLPLQNQLHASIKSHYTLRLSHYQGAPLINYNFNDFTLHCGYIWDLHLLINTQQLLHLYTLHPNDSTVRRAVHCILSKTTKYYGHHLLTNTHGSEALHA